MTKIKKVTFRIETDRFEALELYARSEGASVSFIVRHLVMRFLENAERMKDYKGLS